MSSSIGRALAVAMALALAPAAAWAEPCPIDLNGDGIDDLLVPDVNADGICEWPAGNRVFKGTLTFEAGITVEFTGNTGITADRIVVEPGAVLLGQAPALKRFSLVARGAQQGDVFSGGTLVIDAADDVTLKARQAIGLSGSTTLEAGDRITLQASTGDVYILADGADDGFELHAANRVDIVARGVDGRIDLRGAHVGGYRVVLDTRANVSVVGDKALTLRDGALVTTARARTGLPNQSYVSVDATGRVTVTADSEIDAGTQASFRTSRLEDDVCLSHDVTLAADGGLGRLSFTGVRGRVFDDGTTSFVGRILGGERIEQGACPPEQ